MFTSHKIKKWNQKAENGMESLLSLFICLLKACVRLVIKMLSTVHIFPLVYISPF